MGVAPALHVQVMLCVLPNRISAVAFSDCYDILRTLLHKNVCCVSENASQLA